VEHAIAREARRDTDAAVDGDRGLAARIAAGDRAALEELYARHGPELFGYLVRVSPDRGIAEEILQDTLLAVWRGAGGYAGRATLRTWLFAVARRQAHNTLRRHRPPTTSGAALERLVSASPPPEAEAMATATSEELVEAIGRLAPAHREVLVLTFVEGRSYEETARALRIPVGTVKSRLSNARRALRPLLRASWEAGP
jgi:RNA polymerase sigma-70 factor (ECF subfamily)